MLFLQCGECGFRSAPGSINVGDPCPQCVQRGDGGRLTEFDSPPKWFGERRPFAWLKTRVRGLS